MTKIIYSSGIPQILGQKSIDILSRAGEESKNPYITITSTIRPPRKQAMAMAENLYNGHKIAYAEAGRQVVAVFDANNGKLPRDKVEALMEAKIIELSLKGQRVSLHCVDGETYSKVNIFDISRQSTNTPNPRDLVKELAKYSEVKKIITPFASVYNSPKVKVDAGEPAIHVEISQI